MTSRKPKGTLFTRCKVCGGDLVVIDSRPGRDSFRRRRECPNGCIDRFTTIEIPVDEYRALKAAAFAADAIKRKLRDAFNFIDPELFK